MADAAFHLAVAQIVIVAVDQTGFRQHVARQVRVTPAIGRLIEQPVRRSGRIAAAAIGIESGFRMAGAHEFGDAAIRREMPRLIEKDRRRVSERLPMLQVPRQHGFRLQVGQVLLNLRIGLQVPRRIEHRPADARLAGELQYLSRGAVQWHDDQSTAAPAMAACTMAERRGSDLAPGVQHAVALQAGDIRFGIAMLRQHLRAVLAEARRRTPRAAWRAATA